MKSILLAAAAATTVMTAAVTGSQPRPRRSLPDRLSVEPTSPYYDGSILRLIGVRLDGIDRAKDVVEYDRVEGWVNIQIRNETGEPLRNKNGTWKTKKLTGFVEPYWKVPAPEIFAEMRTLPAEHFISAAEAKRARKAARLNGIAEKGGIKKVSPPIGIGAAL